MLVDMNLRLSSTEIRWEIGDFAALIYLLLFVTFYV